MNRAIRTLAVGCLLLFAALLINVNYIQAIRANGLNDEGANVRARHADCSRKRGDIVVGGNPIAKSVASHDSFAFLRKYTQPKLYAPASGFFSCSYGTRGIENTQNSILSGSDTSLFVNRVIDLFDDEPPEGGSVILTLDPDAQEAAYDGLQALGSRTRGAVVALDPQTGAILAAVSTPSYNPNLLATHNANAARNAYLRLSTSPAKVMLNRGMQEIYPPGSTFKLVTAAAALDNGYTPDSPVKGGTVLDVPQTTADIHNENGSDCGGDQISLTQALEVSCNVAFADLGLKLGDDRLRDQAEAFGFNSDPFDQLESATSQFPEDLNAPETAQSAIGQFDVAASPLQMAMVAAGIANGGDVMQPYVVQQLQSPDLDQIGSDPEPEVFRQATSGTVATELTDMMIAVVQSGTATSMQIPDVEVAAKTGTANSSATKSPYAWMVGFAPAKDDPKVAVAVLIEQSSTPREDVSGGGLAGPIARAVIEAVLE